MIECDLCGEIITDYCHTYKSTDILKDTLYVCDKCYQKSKEKKEKETWERLKKRRQKKED